jgi:CheY-like chemotaxis protein
MPGMDGFTLAQRIREAATLPGTTLMMLSSMGALDSGATQSGISFYLSKPVRQSDLFDAIMTAIGQRTAPARLRHPARRLMPSRPLKILLAEDHPVNQRLAVAILQRWGHSVTVASNGSKAIQAYNGDQFDLLIMDVQMPEMNGLEATRVIRNLEKETGRRIPIIAMTAHAIKGDREHCLAAGMDGYLSKPINAEELFTTIEALFEEGQALTPTRELPSTAPLFNAAKLMDRVGGDRQLLREVVDLFFRDAEPTVEAMGQALTRADCPELMRVSHRLKGALNNLELRAAAELAARLEHMAETNQLAGAHQLIREIVSNLAQARPALVALIQKEAA